MTYLPYEWNDSASLSEQLAVPISRASIYIDWHGRATQLTLWRQQGHGLRIRSKMHTIAERNEIGVLAFSLVNVVPHDELHIQLSSSFQRHITVSKLVISEEGIIAESGVIFRAEEMKIVVTCAVFPCTLAIDGILSLFDPEYPLQRYEEVEFRGHSR